MPLGKIIYLSLLSLAAVLSLALVSEAELQGLPFAIYAVILIAFSWQFRRSFLTQPSPVVMEAKLALYREIVEALESLAGDVNTEPMSALPETMKPFQHRVFLLGSAHVINCFKFTTNPSAQTRYAVKEGGLFNQHIVKNLVGAMREDLGSTLF